MRRARALLALTLLLLTSAGGARAQPAYGLPPADYAVFARALTASEMCDAASNHDCWAACPPDW